MLGVSRWTEKGGSYRTVQRFFAHTLTGASIDLIFVRHHLLRAEHEYVLAGDQTVDAEAGEQTYGLNCFCSSIYGKPVPGLAFFAVALVSGEERRSYPVLVEQRIRNKNGKWES